MKFICPGRACRAVLLLFSMSGIVPLAIAADVQNDASNKVKSTYDASRYGGENLRWRQGQYLDLCWKGKATCTGIKSPKKLGKIDLVLPAPIIRRVRASWLAASKFDSFVCAALKGSATVACAKVAAEPLPLRHAYVDFEISTDNRLRLLITPKHPGIDSAQLALISRQFSKAFWEAARVLQGEADYGATSLSPFTSALSVCEQAPNDPGPQPHPDCVLVTEDGVQMWSCTIKGDLPPEDPPPPGDPDYPPEPEWPEDPEPC